MHSTHVATLRPSVCLCIHKNLPVAVCHDNQGLAHRDDPSVIVREQTRHVHTKEGARGFLRQLAILDCVSIAVQEKRQQTLRQLQFHVSNPAKDIAPITMSVSSAFSAKRLDLRQIV